MNSELSQLWLILSLKIYIKPNAIPLLLLEGEQHVWKYQKFDKQSCKKQVQLQVTYVTSKNRRYDIHTNKTLCRTAYTRDQVQDHKLNWASADLTRPYWNWRATCQCSMSKFTNLSNRFKTSLNQNIM